MFKRSKITLDMCDLFRNANGHLSYDTIQTHFGKTINELRPTILAARKYLERDESVVFENVRGEGYKRLDDSEKVDSLKTFTRRIRRTANNGQLRAHTVEKREELSNDDRLRLTIRETALYAIQTQLQEINDKDR
jgi:DNA-binding winged helix-turn-helix (wHTH) protein